MHLTVRLFARMRELAGTSELSIALAEGATVADARAAIAQAAPAITEAMRSAVLAVNEEYCRDDARVLGDGDVVALIPPVSGG